MPVSDARKDANRVVMPTENPLRKITFTHWCRDCDRRGDYRANHVMVCHCCGDKMKLLRVNNLPLDI